MNKLSIKRKLIGNCKVFLIVSIALLTGGCKMSKNSYETNKELTDRQKNILSGSDLSTDYDDLNATQRMGIDRIEEMLTILEEKYDKQFIYTDYDSGFMDDEALYAYPADGSSVLDIVTMTYGEDEDGNMVYEDNYTGVAVREELDILLQGIVDDIVKDKTVKVYTSDIDNYLERITTDVNELCDNVYMYSMIYIDNVGMPEEERDILSKKIEEVIVEKKLYGDHQILYLNEGYIEELDEYNYCDRLTEEDFYCQRDGFYFDKGREVRHREKLY